MTDRNENEGIGFLVGAFFGWLIVGCIRLSWLVLKLGGRAVSGKPMSGHRNTDATFFSDGQRGHGRQNFFGRGEPSRWELMAGWKRAVVRIVVPTVVYGVVTAVLRWPDLTRWTFAVVLGVGIGVGCWRLYVWVRTYPHMTRYLKPLHEVLAPQLGLEGLKPLDWLYVPTDFREDHSGVRIALPRSFHAGAVDEDGKVYAGAMREWVDSAVYSRLGLSPSEMTATYHMVGPAPVVEYTHIKRPPAHVGVDMVRDAMLKAPESAPVIGLAREHKVTAIDLEAESPHALLSARSGRGKSQFARGQAAQLLARGARVVVLDVRRTSHRWVKDHPHVRYCRDITDIHGELLLLQAECERRNHLIDEHGPEIAAELPRIVVISEEMNAMMRRLNRHWTKVRTNADPKVSPALDAFGDLMFMGREPKINLIGIGQLMTAAASGGNEARENFGTRVLAGYTQNAWRMLVPEVAMPKASKRAGRVQVVLAGNAIETQATYWSDKEAREWAWSCFEEGLNTTTSQLSESAFYQGKQGGTVPETGPSVPGSEEAPAAAAARENVPTSTRENVNASEREPAGRGHLTVVPDPVETPATEQAKPADELVTLKQAADRGLVYPDRPDKELVKESLRAARKRDKAAFPPCVDNKGPSGGQRFWVSDLQRWARNRERGGSESA